MLIGMSKVSPIHSVFKTARGGAYWQSVGLRVIPAIGRGMKVALIFVLTEWNKEQRIAVFTYYREKCEQEFIFVSNRMLEVIESQSILCYDDPFSSTKRTATAFLPTRYERAQSLSWRDQVKFQTGKYSWYKSKTRWTYSEEDKERLSHQDGEKSSRIIEKEQRFFVAPFGYTKNSYQNNW